MSQITTHILDTSIGRPAEGIQISLQTYDGRMIARGTTNRDGRISDLLPKDQPLPPGNYKMVFEIESYFSKMNIKSFYPRVTIEFRTFDSEHYHVPLLLNPFGYSTYRGS